MEINKKALKPYLYIAILAIVAGILSCVFALQETGIIRDILLTAGFVILAGGVVQLLLRRYFLRVYERSQPKKIKEDSREEPFSRDP